MGFTSSVYWARRFWYDPTKLDIVITNHLHSPQNESQVGYPVCEHVESVPSGESIVTMNTLFIRCLLSSTSLD
jgi:hypothetical protein